MRVGSFPVTLLCLALSAPLPVAQEVLWAPPLLNPEKAVQATVTKEMVGAFHLDGSDVVLEHTVLHEVATKYGLTKGGTGQGGDYFEWVCLASHDKAPWVIWLTSGEIDGGRVGGIHVQALSANMRLDPRCGRLSSDTPALQLPIALRLGISHEEVVAALGAPSLSSGDLLLYYHEHEERLPVRGRAEPTTFLSMNSVTVQIHQGIVHAFTVWKSTQS